MKTTPTNSMPRASSPRTSSHGRDRRHFSECTFKLPQWGGLVRLERATLHGRPIDLAHANDLPADPPLRMRCGPCLPRVAGSAECHSRRTSWCWGCAGFRATASSRPAGYQRHRLLQAGPGGRGAGVLQPGAGRGHDGRVALQYQHDVPLHRGEARPDGKAHPMHWLRCPFTAGRACRSAPSALPSPMASDWRGARAPGRRRGRRSWRRP